VWAFAGVTAAGAALAAAETGWGIVSDRTLGFASLAGAGVYALCCASWAKGTGPGGHFDIVALGLLIAAVGAGMAFVASAIVPPSMVFRRVLGWMLVLAGFGVGFIGFAPSLNVNVGRQPLRVGRRSMPALAVDSPEIRHGSERSDAEHPAGRAATVA
jgi:hypothetical protein